MTDELVRGSTISGDFLINGTIPPLVVQPPYQSLYLLTITTGSMLDINDTTDVTFNLFAFVNISISIVTMPMSNVTLHKIGKILYCFTIFNHIHLAIMIIYVQTIDIIILLSTYYHP